MKVIPGNAEPQLGGWAAGRAELGLGAPSAPDAFTGWYSRGFLPHVAGARSGMWKPGNAIQTMHWPVQAVYTPADYQRIFTIGADTSEIVKFIQDCGARHAGAA